MRKTGVYHILSISGLHFALLMALVSQVTRRLPGRGWLGVPLLLLMGGLYVLLSGGDDPILRSALAAGIQAAGRWAGRRVSAWNAQALAGLALLAVSPLHLFQPGFQLSFLATLGILAGRIPFWPKLRAIPLVGQSLAISLGAWIASTPVMACTFFQVSPVALVMNLLAGPFLTLSLAGGVFLVFCPSEPLGASFTGCLELFERACALALEIPAAFLHVPRPSFTLMGGLAALVAGRLGLAKAAKVRERRIFGAAILSSLLLIGLAPAAWRPEGTLTLTALDVGQGDSLVLGLPGDHWVLVDGGGFSASEFDVGERVVLPALLTMGVRKLELAVLTHGHQDHGGGLGAILEALPPSEIWLGRSLAQSPMIRRISDFAATENVPLRHPTRGSLRCFGETCLEVIHPPAGYRFGQPVANDDSLVLRITYRKSTLLLTGDVESEGESLILRSGLPLSAQVLKVAHHGSASSTSDRLVTRIAPSLAIVSVGEGNPWGHPAPKVLERLRRRGVHVLRTDRDGAVQVSSDGMKWRWRPLSP
jgi:competence protein ComEC